MLFSPGPTEIEHNIREIGAASMPYFRDAEYTELILDLAEQMKYLFDTRQTPLLITASGSGTMEMAIQNLTSPGDRVVVLNGGDFGKKWVDMCRAFGLEVVEIKIDYGQDPDFDLIEEALSPRVSALFATAHETSTGYLFDIASLGQLAKDRDLLFVVDAVSSIGADEFHMDDWNCDCTFVSSQKALACMPGLSIIAFSEKAQRLMRVVQRHRYYFDAEEYLANSVRGMIPYTPAMIATLQLRERMKGIREIGIPEYIERHAAKAKVFRERMLAVDGFSQFPQRHTNSMTAVNLPEGCSMQEIVEYVKTQYQWFIAPNSTQVQSYLRISHMGALTETNLKLMADRIEEACQETGPARLGTKGHQR